MSSFPLLVAVSGKLGSGKDYIVDNYILPAIVRTGASVSKMAFADHIKVNVASQDGLSIEQCLSGDKSLELRRKLQTAGTEEGRDRYGPDIWVKTLENWIKLRQTRDGYPDVVLITDCRFPNESQWIMDHQGLLIRVLAPERTRVRLLQESGSDPVKYNAIKHHASEIALDKWKFEYVVQNDPKYANTVKCTIDDIIVKYQLTHLNYAHLLGCARTPDPSALTLLPALTLAP